MAVGVGVGVGVGDIWNNWEEAERWLEKSLQLETYWFYLQH
jgi:hypothetical protein